MSADDLTLSLGGAIELSDLAVAVDRFSKLLRALAEESGGRIRWVLSGLEYGSATLTAAPEATDEESTRLVPTLAHEFLGVAQQVWEAPEASFSRPAVRYVREITALTGRTATEVRFETAADEVVFTAERQAPTPIAEPKAIGTVMGRVQTLQARGSLRFTLYDLVHDKAISCFLRPGAEDLMRGAWGHVVEVTGIVSRDPATDLARSMRDVTDVQQVLVGTASGGFMEAEGVLRAVPGAPSSEEIIRGLRDAG